MTTPPIAPPPPEALAASPAAAPPPPPPYHIRPIPASATFALRHAVLWPDRPPAYVQLAADADGWHFGAFLGPALPAAEEAEQEGEPISVLSLFLDDSLHLQPPANADADNASRTTATTYYRFRKFATAASWQGRGAGSALLRHVMALAAARQPEEHGKDGDGGDSRGGSGGGGGGGGDSEDGAGKKGMKKSPGDGGVVIWCDARQSALPFYARFGFAAAGDVFYKGDVPYLQMSRRLV